MVHLMILKYQQKEPITKVEMLKVVIERDNKQFPVIFEKVSKCLEVISGIDLREVGIRVVKIFFVQFYVFLPPLLNIFCFR